MHNAVVSTVSEEILKPSTCDSKKVKSFMDKQKEKQKFFYDKRRGIKELLPLEGVTVQMRTPGNKSLTPATVVRKAEKTRSYIVKNSGKGKLFRRNRKHLHETTAPTSPALNSNDEDVEDTDIPKSPTMEHTSETPPLMPKDEGNTPSPPPGLVVTRSGRTVKAPKRLDV